MRQDTSGYVRIRQDTSGYVRIRQDTSGYVRIRVQTSAYSPARHVVSACYSGGRERERKRERERERERETERKRVCAFGLSGYSLERVCSVCVCVCVCSEYADTPPCSEESADCLCSAVGLQEAAASRQRRDTDLRPQVAESHSLT
jgi:hypothetical protein